MKTHSFFQKKSPDKGDWRDAFVDAKIITKSMKAKYSSADCVRITECATCSKYKILCAYVSQFESGGFWFCSNDIIYFTTSGFGSDKDSGYEDARDFIECMRADEE